MDRETISRLNAINRRFYDRWAASFDATRRRPWEGWRRVLAHLEGVDRPSILDVGCGNGRFGLFAAELLGAELDYVGVDASRALLEMARGRGQADWAWLETDLVTCGMPEELDGKSFDLVACFGVMHHLPGESTRRRLLGAVARTIAPGGLLAVSFWQLGRGDRFTRRAVDVAGPPLVLEAGDYLLPWGEGSGHGDSVRYCHHIDAAEAEQLLGCLDLVPVESFSADGATGDLNLYHLSRRSGGRDAHSEV